MSTVFDVAGYILRQLGTMSTWKLEKLCYYSQAWALAWSDNHPLFDDEFEAWANGPVCPNLFHEHKGKYTVNIEDFPSANPDTLSEDQKDTIDTVLRYYGSKDPYWLREQTHAEDPWKNARGDLPEGAPSHNVISKASMGAYYGAL